MEGTQGELPVIESTLCLFKVEECMKILCVDDDIAFLVMYQKVLEKYKYPEDEILTSPDSREVVKMVKRQPVDIIITDLVMPQVSGLDILREVKQNQPTTEVIVVTGQGSIDSAVEAMRLGARDYLTKPVNHGMLIEKIENVRELIERTHEAEDYRFAKETVEGNAQKAVTEMEIKLSSYMQVCQQISTICNQEVSPEEKLKQITQQLQQVERNS